MPRSFSNGWIQWRNTSTSNQLPAATTMELAAVMTEITRLGSEFNPLHARRSEAFAVKRGRDEHSAFLHKVEMALDNAHFKSMTRDRLAVHLDPKDQSMADFRTTLRQTENSPWYGAQKHGAKYRGSGNTQSGQRWCEACSSTTHDESSCWEIC